MYLLLANISAEYGVYFLFVFKCFLEAKFSQATLLRLAGTELGLQAAVAVGGCPPGLAI